MSFQVFSVVGGNVTFYFLFIFIYLDLDFVVPEGEFGFGKAVCAMPVSLFSYWRW